VEPGHQFEWGWLLDRWGRLAGNPEAIVAARRLFAIGVEHGVDPDHNIAINALDAGLAPVDRSARLWPQTERIKAALRAAAFDTGDRERHLSQAIDGMVGLKRYLRPNGTWRDKMNSDGRFVDQPAPASSLYHIVGAIAEVMRAARPSDRTDR
jgi:mannose-6-phosphate isomerase